MTVARGPRLRLVCVNDVYTLENLPRLRTMMTELAETDPADVFFATLAGDFLAPSMLSSLDFGRGMVDCINAVPISYVTFGNHEDDVPPEELKKRIAQFAGTWLATNVSGLSPPLPRSRVLEVRAPGGRCVRVGLVGVVMSDETVYRGAPPFGAAKVSPANESAMDEAARLRREEGCVTVIPLTHQPMDDDCALARMQRAPPFPVILGGHEHAIFVETVESTWIVKAGSDAAHAIVVDLTWPAVAEGWDQPSVVVRVEDVARFSEDAPLRARVDLHMRAVHELESATLLRVLPGEVLSSVGTRVKQTTMGTMVCSFVRDALAAEGCVFNGGGIRAACNYPRHFTYGDLKAEVPFDNEVVVVRLLGKVLAAAIEASRAHAPAESGGFLQVDDGMRVEDGRLVAVAGAPIDDERKYRIGIVRNLFTGLDHIEPLIRFAYERPDKIPPAGSGREIKQLLVHALSLSLFRKLGDFDAMDENHDGTVDAHEVAAAITRVNAEPASEVTVALVMGAVDTDHDARISRDEAAFARGDEGGPRKAKANY